MSRKIPPYTLGMVLLAAAFSGCFSNPVVPSDVDENAGENPPPEPPGQTKRKDEKKPSGGFSHTNVFPGEYQTNGTYSRVLQPGRFSIADGNVERFDLDGSGKTAQVGYFLPVAPEGTRFPTIVQASIYYGPLVEGSLLDSYNSNPEQSLRFLVENYVPHGYAVALVPVRGTASNDGCFEWWSEGERRDLQVAIDWIQAQAWSDGTLGFFGLSMAGAAAWMAAGLGDPGVKTIVPISSETDLYSWFVRNGMPSTIAAPFGTPAFWFLFSVSPRSASATPKPARDPNQVDEGVQCPGLVDAVAASEYMTMTGQGDLAWIQRRDLRPAVETSYNGSVFLIHGFHDWLAPGHLVQPWVSDLEGDGIVVKQLWGQWRHRVPDDSYDAYFMPTQRVDFAEILLHWFDYWLKGDVTVDLGPRVQVADSKFQWRREETWPPPAQSVALYANADGLGTIAGEPGEVIIGPDPQRSLVRTTSLNHDSPASAFFRTEPLNAELRFAGVPRLNVTATPLGASGHVTAYLYSENDVMRNLLGWATMDLRFADDEDAAPLIPGTPIRAVIDFEPLDAVVPAGDRLVLELFQGGYGEDIQYFPNRALAPAAYYRTSVPSDPVFIELGPETSLEVPVIFPHENQFFEAPVAAP